MILKEKSAPVHDLYMQMHTLTAQFVNLKHFTVNEGLREGKMHLCDITIFSDAHLDAILSTQSVLDVKLRIWAHRTSHFNSVNCQLM